MVRGTSLSGFVDEVTKLGGDPAEILGRIGIRSEAVGDFDGFITYAALAQALEAAAAATATPDFGRRLARRQGIDIFGPVGVAARTTASFTDALTVFERYLSAYSPAIAIAVIPLPHTETAFFEFRVLDTDLPQHRQLIELSLGIALRVFRFLLGASYTPLSVHVPHQPLTARADYLHYFSCTPRFGEPLTGFTIQAADLVRPLSRDDVAHRAMISYLDTVIDRYDERLVGSVRDLVRQLLPTGSATLAVTARQFRMHPKTLQRRLADEGTTFADVLDDLRRTLAQRWLEDTDMTLAHLSHELGYSDQSVLTRACHRWFGVSPAQFRAQFRSASRLTDPSL